MSCSHCSEVYHKPHLEIWLSIGSNCPTCRFNLARIRETATAIDENIKYPKVIFHLVNQLFLSGISLKILKRLIEQYPKGMPDKIYVDFKRRYAKKLNLKELRMLQMTQKSRFGLTAKGFIEKIFVFIVWGYLY